MAAGPKWGGTGVPEANYAEEVSLPVERVWDVVGDFSAIRKWAVLVQAESTEETPEGKVRSLTMPDGRVVRERLVASGPYSYTYTLERPDMKEYRSTVRAVPAGAGATRIELSIQFTPIDGSATEVAAERMQKNFRGNLKAMKRALGLPT
jgi:hypothetical protein